jgi:hypothetical protein
MSDKIPSHVKPFTLTNVTTAVAYHFRTNIHGGWAICTINDATCELNVQSDWGNWSYRWGGGKSGFGSVGEGDAARARTLTEFIADRDAAHYLADKLWGGGYGGRVFDAEETVKELRKLLCAKRLEDGRSHVEYYRDEEPEDRVDVGTDDPKRYVMPVYKVRPRGCYQDEEWPLTKATARALFDELGELDGCENGDRLIDRFFQIGGHAIVTEEPWEHIATVQAPAYAILLHGILPALVAECRRRTEPLETPPVQCGAV